MVAIHPQRVEDVANSSGAIIEDITELCDFCVEFTETIVAWNSFGPTYEPVIPELSPDPCRLCDIISRSFSLPPIGVKQGPVIDRHQIWTVMRSKRFPSRNWNVWWNYGGWRVDTVEGLESKFTMWAEPGGKPEVCIVYRV